MIWCDRIPHLDRGDNWVFTWFGHQQQELPKSCNYMLVTYKNSDRG